MFNSSLIYSFFTTILVADFEIFAYDSSPIKKLNILSKSPGKRAKRCQVLPEDTKQKA
jgi:hypothetical protein